jgi:hypothetical protein
MAADALLQPLGMAGAMEGREAWTGDACCEACRVYQIFARLISNL